MSEDQINDQRDLIAEDVKRLFRYNQIENEGNDPAISGESYGTPHDLASVYSDSSKKDPNLDVPDEYDEFEKTKIGRPKEKASIYGTDNSAFGRDVMGSKGMKPESPFDKTRTDKVKPFALESLKSLMNKKSKKIVIFEQKESESTLLDERNISNHDI